MTEKPTQHNRPRSLADKLFRVFALLILTGSFGGAWLMMDYHGFKNAPLNLPEEGLLYSIETGSSLRQIAEDLGQRKIISKPYLFMLQAYLNGAAQAIKAGEYALKPGMHPQDLLDIVVTGKTAQYAFTIVEGWTYRQLRSALANDPVLVQTLSNLDDTELMQRLGLPGRLPEGWFLPDTYHYPRGTTDFDFLQRALRAMQKALNEAWSTRAPGLPYQDPYQALIMASIVEKETAVPAEREEIAGVFVRRLQQGMPLQTDPTIIYGMGENYDGNIKRSDLMTDGPYNTYQRRGLTPTPIALPGTAAIHAAMQPAPGDALYFVARGDGTHQFSATLEEHNKAVAKYQLQGRTINDR